MTRSRLWYDESLEPGSGGDVYFRLLELRSTHTHISSIVAQVACCTYASRAPKSVEFWLWH